MNKLVSMSRVMLSILVGLVSRAVCALANLVADAYSQVTYPGIELLRIYKNRNPKNENELERIETPRMRMNWKWELIH